MVTILEMGFAFFIAALFLLFTNFSTYVSVE